VGDARDRSPVANVGLWTLLHTLDAECAEVDARQSGQRREGLFMGFSALVKKLAIGGAGSLVGLGLGLAGYHEGIAPSAAVVSHLAVLFALPTTALVLAALFFFRDYDPGNTEPPALVPAKAAG
jgi:GPH family glycoside/pentoside/hexuronide:cation symporter